MIKEVTATGKTVDAAIDAGCEQLGVERGNIDFEIIDMPRKGFLGLTSIPAKVRVFIELPDPAPAKEEKRPAPRSEAPAQKKEAPAPKKKEAAPAPKKEAAPAPEAKPDEEAAPAASEEKRVYDLGKKPEMAAAYVSDVLKAMGLEQVSVSCSVKDNVIGLKLEGDVSGAAIGRRGETLDALQYLAGLAVNRSEGDYARVVLDSGNYRDKRRGTLEQLARRLANSVIKSGRSTTLEPMNPYERRIIHSTIAEIKGVTSSSIGEEPNRCVVISSTSPNAGGSFEGRAERGDRGPRGGRGRGPRRDDRRSGGRGGRGRREKPAPYQESSIREVPPAEAADQPLYGKIEL